MFPEAVLPITPQGRIYHLDLRPEELADTIITVGDPSRVTTVSQHFDSIECQRAHREFVTHTGVLNGKRVSVVSTGIGTPNIDIVLTELDALKNIDFDSREPKSEITHLSIIRLGTTGGLQPQLPIGELVISNAGIGLDSLLHFYQWTPSAKERALKQAFIEQVEDLPISPYVAAADNQLVNQFSALGQTGITVTCPGFYGPQDRPIRGLPVMSNFSDTLTNFCFDGQKLLNFEMETAALFGMSRLLGHRCVSVATVVANRCRGEFSDKPEELVKTMIEKSLAQL